MRVRAWLWSPLAAFLCSSALAYPRPRDGTENIPKLIADSTLVCKGEVIDAPAVTPTRDPSPPHLTATALVQAGSCFKGEMPPSNVLSILFDGIVPMASSPYVVLRKGEYRLFFLKPENDRNDKYVMVDEWFGQLPISRLLGIAPAGDTDPMHLLESDLKAGLLDADRERVLDSIRMLGNMRRLRSTAELMALLNSSDPLVRTYVYEALLRLHDYSVLPAVDQWFMAQPQRPSQLLLPRDALLAMQDRLAIEVGMIRDPTTLPILLHLLHLPDSIIRMQVLQAVRAMHSPESAPALLEMLDDSNADNGFIAMQALIELAGGGVIEWVPSWPAFRYNPAYYAAKCREWWEAEGKQKASKVLARKPVSNPSQ
jgi:hypothetical protein